MPDGRSYGRFVPVGTIQEATMKLGAHIIATMAVAIFLVPTLFADDMAKPADISRKDESVNSSVDPGSSAKSQPAEKTLLSMRAMSSPQVPAGRAMGGRSARQRGGSTQSNSTPKVELFMGYSYWRAMPQSIRNRHGVHAWRQHLHGDKF